MRNPAKNLPDKMTVTQARHVLPPTVDGLVLNNRELKWVAAYCTNGFNVAEAARVAGYKPRAKAFKGQCAEIVKRPNVMAAVKQFIDMVIQPYRDRLEYEIMEVYYRRATYDVFTFLDEDGELKPREDIPKEWHCCIDGISRKIYNVSGARHTIIEYKLPDRDVALQMLYRMIKGMDGDGPGAGEIPKDIQARLSRIFDDKKGTTIQKTRVTLETITKTKGGKVKPKMKIAPEANDGTE